ncbi:MAG: hypothetical protein RL291_1669 [Pseudomonadota bacterium]
MPDPAATAADRPQDPKHPARADGLRWTWLGVPRLPDGLNSRPHHALPLRLRNLLAVQENASERLTGTIQLGLVLVLTLFWWLAPRPTDIGAGPGQSPVPIALAFYAIVTVVRIQRAKAGPLPAAWILASIVLDMVLLSGLIWSFHVQYGQSPPFALKLPTFVYFFLLIVLRALCLDWRYVVVAGVSAAVSWGLLTVLVLARSAPDVRTRSLVTYMSENRVLLGAEIEKIAVLLAVTALLAFVVYRAEVTLARALTLEAKGDVLSRFMSHGLADAIVQSGADVNPGQAEERDAAVLVLDIRGFTRFAADHSAKDVVALLTAAHARIVPIVRAHGGVIDKFLGDGLMATFGAVKPSTTAAADALRALDATMAIVASWREEVSARGEPTSLDINGAVAAGPVLFATLGALDRLEYTVIGPAANLAAKLEKHNKRAGTRALTTDKTLEFAVAQGYTQRPNLRTIRDEYIQDTPDLVNIVVMA